MHALDRSDHMPVIAEHYLHRAMTPCILLALPNPFLFMAGVPDQGKLTGDHPDGMRPAGTIPASGYGMPLPGCACWLRPRRW